MLEWWASVRFRINLRNAKVTPIFREGEGRPGGMAGVSIRSSTRQKKAQLLFHLQPLLLVYSVVQPQITTQQLLNIYLCVVYYFLKLSTIFTINSTIWWSWRPRPKNGVDVTFSRKLYSLHSTPIHLLVRTVKVITGYCCYRDNYGIVDSVKEWLFRRVLNQYLIIISAEEQLKPAIPR